MLSNTQKLLSMGIQPKPLGEIMLEKGIITAQQHEHILSLLEKEEGKVKIDGYDIMGLIGEGGMGSVYKARQMSMDRVVALKVLPLHYAQNEEYVEKFKTEARIVARLNHENIVSGIDIGQCGGFHYFAMEFVDGAPLSKVLSERTFLEEKEALEISVQVCRAIEHVFKQGVVHCDIKPHNIMMTKNNVAKLCDLGLARPLGANAAPDAQAVGTPHYVSPEQAKGTENVDVRGDIYSLGATLYHLVVGEPPFEGSNPMVVMTKHLTEPVVPPIKKKPSISPGLNSVIMKMLSKRKEDRYQTPDELLKDLIHIQEGKAFAATSSPSGSRKGVGGGGGGGGGGVRRGPSKKRGSAATGAKARALAQRSQHENVSLAVFIFMAIFILGATLWVIFNPESSTPRSSPRNADRAWELLEEAADYQNSNPDDKSGIIQRYERVIDEQDGTMAAQQARDKIAQLQDE